MSELRRFSRVSLVLLAVFVAACGASSSADSEPEPEVTFQRDVRPLLETHCVGCHKAGGIGPFALGYDASEWKDGAPSWAESAVKAVEERRMPPWKADPACRDLAGSRRLSDEAVSVFKRWAAAGFAEGNAGDYKPPTILPNELPEPDIVTQMPEAYTPDQSLGDDYRCFMLPHTFAEETYVTATSLVPGVAHEVHHVVLYSIEASHVATAQALDDETPGPGFTCFGTPRVAGAEYVGSWAPGMEPALLPPATARVLRKGSRLVMQMHYNTSHTTEGIHADRSSVRLWTMAAGQKPSYRVTSFPLANMKIDIPAGEANSVQTSMFSVPLEGTLIGVFPHMHTRGESMELTILKDGASEQCLSRVQDWDFHWQQDYRYEEKDFMELKTADKLRLTCVFDNGQGKERLLWGEGSDDEMCLNYLAIRSPFPGKTLETECPTYHDCIDACAVGNTACIAGCTTATPECQTCTVGGFSRCAQSHCLDEGADFQVCAGGCAGDSLCVTTQCTEQALTFFACIEPHVRAGECDSSFATCGN